MNLFVGLFFFLSRSCPLFLPVNHHHLLAIIFSCHIFMLCIKQNLFTMTVFQINFKIQESCNKAFNSVRCEANGRENLLFTKPSLQNYTLLQEETKIISPARGVHNVLWGFPVILVAAILRDDVCHPQMFDLQCCFILHLLSLGMTGVCLQHTKSFEEVYSV